MSLSLPNPSTPSRVNIPTIALPKPPPQFMAGALFHLNRSPAVDRRSRSGALRPSPPRRSMMITMSINQSYWASINADIDAHLQQAIPLRSPREVFEPMRYFVSASPRNKAPALCIAACELLGGHRHQAIAAASALHLMSAAWFTHEQLPLTDRPKSRPTVEHVYSPNMELLVPDGMMPFGFELLAKSEDPAQDNADRVLRVMIELARAIGSQGVIQGQFHESEWPQPDGEENCRSGWIEKVCKKKEGELHACGAACGAILGGGSDEEVEKLRRFGLCVGMIQGLLHEARKEEKGSAKMGEELRNLALKELEGFKGGKVEVISSFVKV